MNQERSQISGAPRRRFQVFAGLSALLLLAGLGLWATEDRAAVDATPSAGAGAGSLVDTGRGPLPGGTGPGPASTGDSAGASGSWSPFFVKGGLSLFLGFTIGYALRFFFKVSLAAAGVFSLLVLAMAYVGFVEIHWEVLSDAFDSIVARVQEESQAFHSFVTGSVPSAGLAATGLVAGARRR